MAIDKSAIAEFAAYAGLIASSIFAAIWLIGYKLKHPQCRVCGYDATGLNLSLRPCPECGRVSKRGALPPGRRRRHFYMIAAVAVGGVSLLSILLANGQLGVRQIPTALLCKIAPLPDDSTAPGISEELRSELVRRVFSKSWTTDDDRDLNARVFKRMLENGRLFRCPDRWPEGTPLRVVCEEPSGLCNRSPLTIVVTTLDGTVLYQHKVKRVLRHFEEPCLVRCGDDRSFEVPSLSVANGTIHVRLLVLNGGSCIIGSKIDPVAVGGILLYSAECDLGPVSSCSRDSILRACTLPGLTGRLKKCLELRCFAVRDGFVLPDKNSFSIKMRTSTWPADVALGAVIRISDGPAEIASVEWWMDRSLIDKDDGLYLESVTLDNVNLGAFQNGIRKGTLRASIEGVYEVALRDFGRRRYWAGRLELPIRYVSSIYE